MSDDPSASTYNARARLRRILNRRQRKSTKVELTELHNLLKRAAPERMSSGQSWYIGMEALTLTRDRLKTMTQSSFVFHKVDGIGVLAAMFPINRNAAAASSATASTSTSTPPANNTYTMLCIRRNGTFAIDDVPLPLRPGRVLIHGELCLRRKLTQAEQMRIGGTIECVVGFDYLDPDDGNEADDDKYEIVLAAHDLLVADDSSASSARSRTGDAVCVQDGFGRLSRLLELTQAPPMGDARADEAVATAAADFADGRRSPAVTVLFKTPYVASMIRLALRTLPSCLHGVRTDGLIVLPNNSEYMIGQTNPRLLKYKMWRENTGDFVLRRTNSGDYTFFVVNNAMQARPISNRLWFGDNETQRRRTVELLALEEKRLADGGDKNSPLIFECEPSLGDDREQFFGLCKQHTGKELLHAAHMLLRWRPINCREEKMYPNSEINFWFIVEALINHIEPDELVQQLSIRPQLSAAGFDAARRGVIPGRQT